MILPDKEIKKFIQEHESSDVRQLALQAALYPHINMRFAIEQISGRLTAKHKIPWWYEHEDIIYPVHLPLEQSSSEKTAIYKSGLCQGNTFTDLTGGLGVDFSFMSQSFKKAVYVEQQAELAELAKYNFAVLNIQNCEIVNQDAVGYLHSLKSVQDIIYLDPARRDNTGKKTVFIEDCTPNILEIEDLLDKLSKKTLIKLSPMLDISHALNSIDNIVQVHIISIANECKELVFIKEKEKKDTEIMCVNILNNGEQELFSYNESREHDAIANYTNHVNNYLYEPNSSIMKAGAFKTVAISFGLKKLHPNSHLYTSDTFIPDFPGRKFLVKQVLSPNKKEIKSLLSNIKQANITVRNYPFSVSEIRKQTKIKEGGSCYIFATTLADEKKVLILCDKVGNHTI